MLKVSSGYDLWQQLCSGVYNCCYLVGQGLGLICVKRFVGGYVMGKSVENPKKFIVSCRINDREMEQLQKLAKQSGTNISNLLRRSLLGLTEVEG